MNRYLKRDFYRVAGYTSLLDARFFDLLVSVQSGAGIQGSLAEIGVHHGRSFFILAGARQAGEKALAIDVFEDDAINRDGRHSGRGVQFRRNCARLGVALADEEVYVGLSTSLDAEEIRRRVGPVRFFSVDGGHRYDDVAHDLRLAAAALDPQGVIVADDFMNAQWPEVSLAVVDWLRGDGSAFTPFLATVSKLYLCARTKRPFYQDAVRSFLADERCLVRETALFEESFVFVRQRASDKLGQQVKQRILATL